VQFTLSGYVRQARAAGASAPAAAPQASEDNA
jgi:hypothetical protein